MDRVWSLNKKLEFTYRLENFDTITTENYIEAVDKTTASIIDNMTRLCFKKVGLCLSGMDSEIILRSLIKHDIDVECFFLLIENHNLEDLELVKKLTAIYSKPLHVVSLSLSDLLDFHIYRNFLITKVCWPTYVSVPSLIEQIPIDYFIIIGEGDLEKNNNFRYERIFYNHIKSIDTRAFYIPISLTEISYQLSFDYFNRQGEANFFSRIFDTWYHVLRNPLLKTNRKYYYDPKEYFMADLAKVNNYHSPLKTLNYKQQNLKYSIMKNLYEFGQGIKHWDPFKGNIITIPESLINNL